MREFLATHSDAPSRIARVSESFRAGWIGRIENYGVDPPTVLAVARRAQPQGEHERNPTLGIMTMGRAGALLPGERYRLIEHLGDGSYGEVWKARDQHRGQDVAFKFLVGTERRKAWREATLLTTLNSPHILKVNNADMIGDVPFIDTKLARSSFDKFCFPGGIEPHRAVEAIRRVLRALELCHSVQLIHRDVKPGNVFEDFNGDVVLGDFGIASLADPNGEVPRGGDPRIAAPEGWTSGSLTFQSDLYSTAVTLYVFLTGRWPFNQASQADLELAVR